METEKKSEPQLTKKEHISYSQIQTGRCKLRYKHLVLLKDIVEESEPMRLGKVVHKILAVYSRECIKNKLEADFELIEQVIEKSFNESGLDEKYFKQVRETCINFGERGFNYDTLLLYEHAFKFKVCDDRNGNPIMVKGIVDRVNVYETPDGACADIIDYKNQKNILTEEQVLNHDQLNLYAYWFFMDAYRNGFYIGRTGIYHTAYNFTRWMGERKHVSDWAISFDNTEKWLIRQWNRLILSDDFKPGRGTWCFQYSGCPVMLEGKCPLWTDEEVEKMRKNSLVLDRVRALRKVDFDRKVQVSLVKELFEIDETADVDGQTVGYNPSIGYKYDLTKFMKWLEKYGVVPEGLTVTKTDAEGIVKRLQRGKMETNGEAVTEEHLAELEGCKIETAQNKFVF